MAIVGYWRLNGNSNDASGSGYNGTDSNIVYSNGYAIFDGYSSGISLGNIFNFSGTTPYTININFLVYEFPSSPNWVSLLSKFNAGVSGQWYVATNYSQLFYGHRERSPWSAVAGTMSNNIWYNGTVIYNGTTYTAYLNSTPGIPNTIGSVSSSALVTWIGRFVNTTGYFYNGAIDNIIVDNTAWNYAKIKNEYSRSNGFF